MGQLVAIVGRPNVGKSTLFNRLTETRQAIVDPTAGTTRDRQYGKVEWGGKEFSIVDTGGWVVNSDDIFEGEINKQVEIAIEQADEVLFVVDAMNGVTDLDDHVAEILRRSRKPVILVANKVDSNDWLYNVPEFYSLGLGDPMPVSAVSGYGTGDLLDEIIKKLPEPKDEEETLDDIPRFAIVGRPNAGKSSLINAFIGEDRHIVTDIAGTTRDTVEEKVTVGGVLLRLIDTAGIRDGGDAVETMGVERSRAAAKQASLALLVLDGSRELTAEDEAAIALANTVPHLIVAVNKSDLPRALDVGALADRFDNVLSVSAATGAGLDTLTDAIAAQFPAGESTGGALLTNARQADAANRALSAVTEARGALRIGMTPDVVLTDCEAALAALGELNGKQVRDDLVDTIFSRFCVGK